jgi:hypothetical protein
MVKCSEEIMCSARLDASFFSNNMHTDEAKGDNNEDNLIFCAISSYKTTAFLKCTHSCYRRSDTFNEIKRKGMHLLIILD